MRHHDDPQWLYTTPTLREVDSQHLGEAEERLHITCVHQRRRRPSPLEACANHGARQGWVTNNHEGSPVRVYQSSERHCPPADVLACCTVADVAQTSTNERRGSDRSLRRRGISREQRNRIT
ncbi:hypothetical protein [Falsiroseomonas oryziterrae]|uniref:hypothetical protein n=1 Tax=Falsiroseomonas oryziterrae TaxID=2911368 RepID=UPI001F21DF0C|nr:hypothetical protein [Roseomonas sp. NPKOSM-4]